MLADVAPILRKLAYGHDLSVDDTRRALDVIGAEDLIALPSASDGFYFLALTFGLMAKGPTAEELRGFVLSISDHSVRFETTVPRERLLDVSGTGGDLIKTFNVGTAAGILAAAAGAFVAKQATRGYTGLTGSADVYRALGLDVSTLRQEVVVPCLEKVGVVPFYTPAFSSGFQGRIDFLTKLRLVGLTYPTPWHLVSWVFSPFRLGARLYGVYDRRYLRVIAELFRDLGYQRAMVVHGVDGLDEVSTVGDTLALELRDGMITERVLTPEACGVARATISDIQTLSVAENDILSGRSDSSADLRARLLEEGKDRNVATFLRVLYGLDKGPRRDLAVVNAGTALYLAGVASDISAGVSQAQSAIDTGLAREKLRALVVFCGDIDKLRAAEERYGV
jgi:anthranilate phosphoribosyltransferase